MARTVQQVREHAAWQRRHDEARRSRLERRQQLRDRLRRRQGDESNSESDEDESQIADFVERPLKIGIGWEWFLGVRLGFEDDGIPCDYVFWNEEEAQRFDFIAAEAGRVVEPTMPPEYTVTEWRIRTHVLQQRGAGNRRFRQNMCPEAYWLTAYEANDYRFNFGERRPHCSEGLRMFDNWRSTGAL